MSNNTINTKAKQGSRTNASCFANCFLFDPDEEVVVWFKTFLYQLQRGKNCHAVHVTLRNIPAITETLL